MASRHKTLFKTLTWLNMAVFSSDLADSTLPLLPWPLSVCSTGTYCMRTLHKICRIILITVLLHSQNPLSLMIAKRHNNNTILLRPSSPATGLHHYSCNGTGFYLTSQQCRFEICKSSFNTPTYFTWTVLSLSISVEWLFTLLQIKLTHVLGESWRRNTLKIWNPINNLFHRFEDTLKENKTKFLYNFPTNKLWMSLQLCITC